MNSDIDIKYEDQIKINEFSKLHQKKNVINQELKKLEEAVKKVQDCLEELENSLEDEVDYQFGDCFIVTPVEEASKLSKTRLISLKEDMSNQSAERNFITKRLKELKGQLYAKFGNNINLEE